MKHEIRRVFSAVAAVAFAMTAGTALAQQQASTHVGVPQDWSTQRVVYTHPDTPDEAARKGQTKQWLRKAQDPRFVVALERRLQAEDSMTTSVKASASRLTNPAKPPRIKRDWNVALGKTAGVGSPGIYPAKYSFDINATPSCANDFVVDTTAAAGSTTQPTILAYNNLYKTTCTGTVPNAFWAYNTGAAITETSPVLSFFDNGAQVAFVQRVATSNPDVLQLVLLKWSSGNGTVAAPMALTSQLTAAAYRSCTAPCMYVMPLSGTSDTNGGVNFSSPFVDYPGDVLWVGDAVGHLHKFTGVFEGTPTEVTSGGFPATVDANSNALYAPVYDATSGMVFVGSDSAASTGGKLSRVNVSTGAVVASGQLAAFNTTGVSTDPILDSSSSLVYESVFADTESTNTCDGVATSAGTPCHGLFQFSTTFGAGTTGNRVQIGHGNTGNTTEALYVGTFDNDFYNTGIGNFYICASTADTTSERAMWKVPINAGNAFGTPAQGADVSNQGATGNCSPVTESMNGSHEYLYVSMPDTVATAGSGACTVGSTTIGCLYMFDLTALNAATSAKWVGSFTGNPTAGQTVVVNGITLTASATSNTGLNFEITAAGHTTTTEHATDLAAAINRNVSGFTATHATTTVTITDNTTGSGVSSTLVTENLLNFGPFVFTDGTDGTTWGTTNVPAASLPVPGGTGGIAIDNVSALPGTSQVYFSNLTSPGKAYQASQSNLQ